MNRFSLPVSLEKIETTIYEIEYPDLKGRTPLPTEF
jgi:hypothetical protein